MSISEKVEKATILIVDDMPENVGVLFNFLTEHQFEVLVARNGKSALHIIETMRPDLVLLDIMMPQMSGFEVCEQVKRHEGLADIPIIFMTALSDTNNKIKGFNVGAVDYITKPFHQEEVLARIHTHLRIAYLQNRLKIQNQELAFKNADLDAFSSMVAHDLKTPLNAIIGLTDILLNLQETPLEEKQREYLELIFQSGNKMHEIINALLLLAMVSKKEIKLQPLNMREILEQVQLRLQRMAHECLATIEISPDFPVALGHPQWVEEVWANYMSNALKYGGRPPYLEIGGTLEGDIAKFWVKDNGQGIPEEMRPQVFKPFTRLVKERDTGHGLGLTIVQRIVQKLGGDVYFESEENKGSIFYFSLPMFKEI